jgi:hypothetical protein
VLPQVTSPLELNLLQEKEYFRELKVRCGEQGSQGRRAQTAELWLAAAGHGHQSPCTGAGVNTAAYAVTALHHLIAT